MSEQETTEIKTLIAELRDNANNEIFKNASDFEILKALLECAIIKSK